MRSDIDWALGGVGCHGDDDQKNSGYEICLLCVQQGIHTIKRFAGMGFHVTKGFRRL